MTRQILVIEDDGSTAAVIVRTLLREDFEPIHVDTGAAALAEAQARAGQLALVICDMHLPDTDGLAIQQALKQDGNTSHLPLIFLTGVRDTNTVRSGLSAGAVQYICKPFSPEELVDAVREVLAD